MDFKQLLDYCKAQAILNTISSTELSVWREMCRNYSQKFSTPLHQCLDGTIPPEDILIAEYEDQLSEFKEEHLEHMLEEIYVLEDPLYEKEKRKELDDFMVQAEKEEAERIRLGKPIHPSMKKDATLQEETTLIPKEPKRTGGSINLSYLAKEEDKQSGNFES